MPINSIETAKKWSGELDKAFVQKSATGFLAGIVFGVFGITLEEDKLTFHPCVPKNMGTMQIQGISFRNVILDIELKESEDGTSSIVIILFTFMVAKIQIKVEIRKYSNLKVAFLTIISHFQHSKRQNTPIFHKYQSH